MSAIDLAGLDEVEFEVRPALGQGGGPQYVMHTIEEVVVEVEAMILDEHRVAAGHAAHRNDDAFLVTLEINLRLNRVSAILDGCR